MYTYPGLLWSPCIKSFLAILALRILINKNSRYVFFSSFLVDSRILNPPLPHYKWLTCTTATIFIFFFFMSHSNYLWSTLLVLATLRQGTK